MTDAEQAGARIASAFEAKTQAREGRKYVVYLDDRGVPTVGIGHKVLPTDNLKVGDRIDDARIEDLWTRDSASALAAGHHQAAMAGIQDEDFIVALSEVSFQLGGFWWLEFTTLWRFIRSGMYAAAARDITTTKWFQQTPVRAKDFQEALLAMAAKVARP